MWRISPAPPCSVSPLELPSRWCGLLLEVRIQLAPLPVLIGNEWMTATLARFRRGCDIPTKRSSLSFREATPTVNTPISPPPVASLVDHGPEVGRTGGGLIGGFTVILETSDTNTQVV